MSNSYIGNDGYVRPKKTYTDQLDDADIEDKLAEYVKVDNIDDVPINSHLRYFTLEMDKKTGTMKRLFRMGGFLVKKDENNKYVVLSNGKKTWTAQLATSVFYKKLSLSDIKEEYENEIENLKKINKKLYKQNMIMKTKLEELGYQIK